MKKFFAYISILLLAVSLISCESNDNPIVKGTSDFRASSKVLVEFFTNHRCVNCPQPAHYLDQIDSLKGITANDTNVVIIRIHTDVVSLNDPFFLYNKPDNLARENYYGANLYNPITFLMGIELPQFNAQTWTTLIENRLRQENQFGIILGNTFDTAARTGTLNVNVGQLSGSAVSDLVLHVVLTESNLYYHAPNGEDWHHNTLRKLVTGPNGMSISIQPGQSEVYNIPYTVPSEVVSKNSHLVVFVQGVSSKTVFGVERVKVKQ